MNAAKDRCKERGCGQLNVKAHGSGSLFDLPIFFTAAINRALSSATNFENSGTAA
ncbi:hypothetical protein [Bradyrhizobium viridifuturi]|uniref:hypothetical protein n=1 Tax=Bradyrhizobium viridifuturi TaxID=1654716 RepID=UPI0012FF55AC|nr:hypothetical protein [Bradyrhizobium viridifuturi]